MMGNHELTAEDEFALSGLDAMIVVVARLLACGVTVAELGGAVADFLNPLGATALGQLVAVLEEAEQKLLRSTMKETR